MMEVNAALFGPILAMIIAVMIAEKAVSVCISMVGFVKSVLR
jgi:hypothetical protein